MRSGGRGWRTCRWNGKRLTAGRPVKAPGRGRLEKGYDRATAEVRRRLQRGYGEPAPGCGAHRIMQYAPTSPTGRIVTFWCACNRKNGATANASITDAIRVSIRPIARAASTFRRCRASANRSEERPPSRANITYDGSSARLARSLPQPHSAPARFRDARCSAPHHRPVAPLAPAAPRTRGRSRVRRAARARCRQAASNASACRRPAPELTQSAP